MIKRNLLVMGLAVLLSACGFQLRGTGTTELAIKELDVSARNAYGETVTQLRQTLKTAASKSIPERLTSWYWSTKKKPSVTSATPVPAALRISR